MAILVALSMLALIIVGGLVLDFGLVRLDRQINKSAADSAAMSGLEAMRHVSAAGEETGQAAPYPAVCSALSYLRATQPELSSLTGTVKNGVGSVVLPAPACPLPAASALEHVACDPDDRTTWAWFSGTADGGRIRVEIKNGYVPNEDATSFREENLASLAADQGSTEHKGCDQLAVIITETRTPGLGSLASDDDMTFSVRSVARVNMGSNPVGVALLILEQKDCASLTTTGSAFIRVDGFDDVPGMIHVDSDGSGDDCTANSVIDAAGSLNGAIVAGESEDAPKVPGVISAYATSNVSKGIPYIYSEPYLPGGEPVVRPRITRKYVDNDYFTGVKAAISKANGAWAAPTTPLPTPSSPDVTIVNSCTGAGLPPAANNMAAGTWYFNCPTVSYNGNIALPNAERVIFAGQLEVRAGNEFAIPKAKEVYINPPSSTDEPGLLVKGQFRMHTNGNADCKTLSTAPERARLVIGNGDIRSAAGSPLFQACHTSVIMMGGQTDGCVPDSPGLEPQDSTACNGYIDLTGGAGTDWTAPNLQHDERSQAEEDDLEDLAFWTENHETSSILGGGGITLAGIFVLPNANPFKIGGNGAQDVRDSQYFVRKLQANGTATTGLNMKPDPKNMTKVPFFDGFALVR